MAKRHFLKPSVNRSLFVFFLLAFFLTTTTDLRVKPSAAQETRKSCLWSIQTQSNKIYLLGSLHVLKQDAYPLAAAIGGAYADSQRIVFETDMAAMKEPAIQAKMLQLGLYPQGQNLQSNLDERTRQSLEKKMTELGLPFEQFSRFRPWFVAITLATLELQRLGFNPNYGIDLHFFNKATADGKEIGFLEPPEFQIDLLGNMVSKDQNSFLSQTLKDLELINDLATDLVKFWQTGKSGRLHDLLYKSFKDYPDLHDRLLIKRNKKWIKNIEDAMHKNKNVLFVVGVGHLVGPQSVIDLLEGKGYTVKQL